MKTEILSANDEPSISQALSRLQNDELVAYPTDTVYGVGALAFSQNAIQQLFIAKMRPNNKAIPILLGDPDELQRVAAHLSGIARRLAKQFWPGPLTLVIAKHPDLPQNISPFATIGVRMPNHPLALELLHRSGPLATTSANISGQTNATTAQQVYDQLVGRIPLILDGGETPGGNPSTVVECTGPSPIILRPGPITQEQIQEVLGE